MNVIEQVWNRIVAATAGSSNASLLMDEQPPQESRRKRSSHLRPTGRKHTWKSHGGFRR